MVKQRRCNIPPELRAMARAVSDADTRQFPDLAPAPGRAGPPVSALRHITTELNDDKPLSAREFKLFRAACEECRQHLHSVTNGIIASGTPIADVLVLAVRMDILCTDLGLSLPAVFPTLREIHTYLLDLSDQLALGRGELQRQGVLLDRLMRFLHSVLERGERALRDHETWETQRDTSNPDRGALKAESSMAAASAVANSPREAVRVYSAGNSCRTNAAASDIALVSCRASPRQPSAHESSMAAAPQPKAYRETTAAAAAGATVADTQELIPVSGQHLLPLHVADAVASVNADLDVHFAHIRWYVKATDEAPVYFDAHAHLEDNMLRNAWDVHVGRNRAACTTEEFLPFLPLFPSWTHGVIMAVLNFKDCGVISLYSLQRFLSVWGPLQLLEANLRHELELGAVDLSEPFAYLAFSLAARSDAMAGDYVVGLTDVIGEVRVAVLRRARGHHWHLRAAPGAAPRSLSTKRTGRGSATSTMTSPAQAVAAPRKRLVTVSYTLSHATGAWMVKGLAREEFDSVAGACAAFAEIFQRPCGQPLRTSCAVPLLPTLAHPAPLLPLQGTGSGSVAPAPSLPSSPANPEDATEGNASALHRACYRNNARYVRTLLHRGGGTVINVALVDPLVSDSFCWTPLLCAVNNPHSDPVELVLQLLGAGAEVEYMDDADCTALYYAIANGYAETTRVLLEHCPTLSTSPYTVPLLVAIGAHDCHLRACDVQRLMMVVPTAAVLRVMVAYESSLALVALASTIVEEKLSGKDHSISSAERYLVAQRCSAPAEQYTSAETEQLKRWVHHHTQCCLRARQNVQEAVRVLYARQYALSWRVWLDALGAEKRDGAAPLSLTEG
ncbi:Ankyrin repeats (3 copies) [Leishmania donovani]|nr:Ankyrin repeats (3 copies) [Leishmania donovani]VDZ46382.1 Ankyrin_repeats_(3_copies)_putative/Pfam:PF12796 [Leishmania donovani]